jgi:HK97 family phage portal protein
MASAPFTPTQIFVGTNFATECRATIEDPTVPLAKAADLLFGSTSTEAGVRINARNSLNIGAVHECVDMVANDLAGLPLEVFKSLRGGGKCIDKYHPSNFLVRRKPCAELNAFYFWHTLQVQCMLWGNSYAYIYRKESGAPDEIVPLLPDRTFPFRLNHRLLYRTTVGTTVRILRAEDVLHFRGLGINPHLGIELFQAAATSFGLAMAAEIFGARFFNGGATSSGIIFVPPGMDEEDVLSLKAALDQKHTGLTKSHKYMVLEEGTKFEPTSIKPNEAQMLETRELARREIAGWFKIPPSRIGDTKARTFATMEQDDLRYYQNGLRPWGDRREEECWDKLLTEKEKRSGSHAFGTNYRRMMRTDTRSRMAYYQSGLTLGWLNRNEVREEEGLNPIPGKSGNEYYVALNMAPGDSPRGTPPSRTLIKAHRELLADEAQRLTARVARQALRAAQGPGQRADGSKFVGWLDELIERDGDRVARDFRGVETAITAATDLPADDLGTRLLGRLHAELAGVANRADADTLLAEVERATDAWPASARRFAEEFLPYRPRRRRRAA